MHIIIGKLHDYYKSNNVIKTKLYTDIICRHSNGHMYLSVFIRKCHSVAANVVLFLGGLFLYSFFLFLSVHIEPSVPLLKEKKSDPGEHRNAHSTMSLLWLVFSPRTRFTRKRYRIAGNFRGRKLLWIGRKGAFH